MENRKLAGIFSVFAVCLSLIIAISLNNRALATSEESCKALLKDRCASCHYLTRVCHKVEREMNKRRLFGSAEGTWKRIIHNMVKQGARLNDHEEGVLIQCLSTPTDEALSACKIRDK